MKQFKFKKIDAFATEQSSGNPAGYISLNSFDEISEKKRNYSDCQRDERLC